MKFMNLSFSSADPVVYSIEPTYGSLAGGTMVFVHGRGT